MNTITKSSLFFLFSLTLVGIFLPLSETLFAQTTKTLTSNNEIITTMDFSNSGKYFCVGGNKETLEVWDLSSGERITQFKEHNGIIMAAAISPNEDIIASAEQGIGGIFSVKSKIEIWDLNSGEELLSIMAGLDIRSLDFSADGSKIVAGGAGKIQLFSTETGKLATEFKLKKNFCFASFSGDDKIFAVLVPYELQNKRYVFKPNNYTLKSFDSVSGEELSSFATPEYWELCVKQFEMLDLNLSAMPPQTDFLSFSKPSDANLLFILKQGNVIEIWDPAEGTQLGTLKKGFTVLKITAEDSGRYIATCGDNNLISIWDLASVPEVASRMATK